LFDCPSPIFDIVGGADFVAATDPPVFASSPIKFIASALGFAMNEPPSLNYDRSADLTLSIGLSANPLMIKPLQFRFEPGQPTQHHLHSLRAFDIESHMREGWDTRRMSWKIFAS
jgi:hypothetical protein